jgi:kinetochore protein Nuf2
MHRQSLGSRNQAKPQQSFSFPALPPSEIISCMAELGIQISAEELKTCPRDIVRRIYEALIDLCMGVTKEELYQPKFEALQAYDDMPYQQLHEDAVPEIQFYRAVSAMLTVCGVPGCTLKDITEPDPKRLKHQLSGVINFAKFREERLQWYTDLTEHTEGLMENRKKVAEENERLKSQLADLHAQRDAEMPAMRQLESENRGMEARIEELNRRQATLRTEVLVDLKQHGGKVKEDIDAVQFQMINVKHEIPKLQLQVVSDPERLTKDVASLSAEVQKQREEVTENERRLRSTQSHLERLALAGKDVSCLLNATREAEEEVDKLNAATKEVAIKKAQMGKDKAEVGELQAAKQTLSRHLARVSEKRSTLAADDMDKNEAADAAVVVCQGELTAVQGEAGELRATNAEALRAIEELELRKRQQQAAHAAEAKQFATKWGELTGSVRGYHREILGTISNRGSGGPAGIGA